MPDPPFRAVLGARSAVLALALMTACSGAPGETAGNTELNVLIPSGSSQSGPGAPAAFDIQVVEYTINCSDGVDFDPTSDPDIDTGPTLNNDVVINGVLEVLDSPNPGVSTQDFGPDLGEVYVFQGFMDLPETVGCSAQLRARDGDGEIICTATESFDIAADTLTTVNILMFCGISYQAPVGMLDINADFSFNVANYCPDLFILNCIDSELDVRTIPGFGDVLATACQVRFRDADSTCGNSCDPQQEIITPTGIDILPGPDPGVSTRVTCAGRLGGCAISCDGANPAAFCDFTGDTLGAIGDPPPAPLAPGIGGFFVRCETVDHDNNPFTPEVPVTPGDDIQCVATTTDGDIDCDKVKTVDLTIRGCSPCCSFDLSGGDCDDGNDCTDDVCNDATCDGATGAACCFNPNSPAGQACSVGSIPGTCDGAGTCVSTNCNVQPDPDGFCQDGNVCTTNACEVTGICSSTPTNEGGACDAGNGGSSGICQGGTCVDNCTGVDCGDGNECTADVCDATTDPGTCSNPPQPSGAPCDSGAGPGSGTCDGAGVCNCVPCTDDAACEVDGEECTIPPPGACLPVPTCGCLPEINAPDDTPCASGTGTCQSGSCFDNCTGVDCDDGNQCTADLCDNTVSPGACSNPPQPDGTPCDAGGGPGSGACDGSGTCQSLPVVGVGSGATTWQALPTTAIGCTYEPIGTICTGCTITGPSVPGGGQCGAFGTQVVGGCEVPGGVLDAQLAIDTTITLSVSSAGDGNLTHDFTVLAENPALSTGAGLVTVDAASFVASITTGIPATVQNGLNPAFAGQLLGAFTGGGNVLELDNDAATGIGVEIPMVTTAVQPTSTPTVDIAYDTFSVTLTVVAGGTPLLVNHADCIFDFPGAPITLPVN